MNVIAGQFDDPSFYKRANEDPTEDINKGVRFYLKRLLANNIIDKQTHCYLTPENPKAGRFYTLPKIHKPGNPGRPIRYLRMDIHLKKSPSLLVFI